MAIAFSNLGASANPDINSTSNLTSYSNSAWTPGTGLVICFARSRVANASGDAPPDVPSVSGNGLTWVEVATVTFELSGGLNRARITLFAADNSSGSATNGATTFDFGAEGQVRFEASFFLATGVDLSGGVLAAFVQTVTDIGHTVTSLSLTLAAAGSADNRPIAGFSHAENETVTPRTNWTEMDELLGSSPTHSLETQVREDAFETTASASWTTSIACGGIAAELKADTGGGGSVTLTADHGSFSANGQTVTFQSSMIVDHGSFS